MIQQTLTGTQVPAHTPLHDVGVKMFEHAACYIISTRDTKYAEDGESYSPCNTWDVVTASGMATRYYRVQDALRVWEIIKTTWETKYKPVSQIPFG